MDQSRYDRFLALATRKEPALTIGGVAALILTVADQYLHFTEGQISLLVYAVPIIIAGLIRLRVFSPDTVDQIRDQQDPPA